MRQVTEFLIRSADRQAVDLVDGWAVIGVREIEPRSRVGVGVLSIMQPTAGPIRRYSVQLVAPNEGFNGWAYGQPVRVNGHSRYVVIGHEEAEDGD